METVELGRVPSMYNPKFVKSVREKRRLEALHRRLERHGEAAEAASIRKGLLAEQIVIKPRELTRQERVKLASAGPLFRRVVMRFCRVFGVYPSEIFSRRRHKRMALVRFAICYWMCRLSKLSTPQIGKLMERDHTSVLYAKAKYTEHRKAQGRYLRPAR